MVSVGWAVVSCGSSYRFDSAGFDLIVSGILIGFVGCIWFCSLCRSSIVRLSILSVGGKRPGSQEDIVKTMMNTNANIFNTIFIIVRF